MTGATTTLTRTERKTAEFEALKGEIERLKAEVEQAT